MIQPPESPFTQFEPLEPQARNALENTTTLAIEHGTLAIDCSLLLLTLIHSLTITDSSSGSQTLDRLLQQPGALNKLDGAFSFDAARRGTSGKMLAVGQKTQHTLDLEAQLALRHARQEWATYVLNIPMLLNAVLEESEVACGLLRAIAPVANSQQLMGAIKRELRNSITPPIRDRLTKPEDQQLFRDLRIIKASFGAKYANFHVSLRDAIIGRIHSCEGRFPVVVTARLGEPTGSYINMASPMIGQVLADFLSWPDISTPDIAPLRPNQQVFLVSGQELLDLTLVSPTPVDVLTQVVSYVQEQKGLLLIQGLEILVTDITMDASNVQAAKERLKVQFRNLAKVCQAEPPDRRLVVVALFQRDPRDTNEDTVVQTSLGCGINQHVTLVSVRRYPTSRAIGSVRDYHLQEWLERNFTVEGLDRIQQGVDPIQTLKDSRRHMQLGSSFDLYLRSAFSDLINLEHGAYVNDERMRVPYLLVEVFNSLMEVVGNALQTKAEERRIRELAYQGRTNVADLLHEIPIAVPENVRQHYIPLLKDIEQRLSSLATHPGLVVRRDSYGRIVVTRDLISACFLGSNQSRFKWPLTGPRPADEGPSVSVNNPENDDPTYKKE